MAEQRAAGSGSTSPAQESATQVRDKAQEVSAQVRETAADSYGQGREQIAQVGQSLEEYIREKPLPSMLMAAGIGMIIAFLWKH
jgi:ElaB/YqjD/DUF883 family membrane-anchored ribosome-binding protein